MPQLPIVIVKRNAYHEAVAVQDHNDDEVVKAVTHLLGLLPGAVRLDASCSTSAALSYDYGDGSPFRVSVIALFGLLHTDDLDS
jgi:hypothetical protein